MHPHLRAMLPAALVTLIPAIRAQAQAPSRRADLVLVNAVVATMDSARPTAEAVAITGGRIAAVGTNARIRALAGPGTRVLDLHGAFVTPGFIESHGHFMALGAARLQLDLTHARTWDDIVQLVAAAVKRARPGEWVVGRGWHQEKWTHPPEPNVEGLPLGDDLAAVSPDNPVLLEHAS